MFSKEFLDNGIICFQRDDAYHFTSDAILLSRFATAKKGEVVAVGLGKMNDKGEREPMDVKVGDVVLYAKYAGNDIKMDGVEYKILSVKDALAVIE